MNPVAKTELVLSGMKKIALVGHPNVGKSVIFSHLTGTYVTVSNYPGTTVEIARGTGIIGGQKYEVIDTPGMYSVTPHSEDEKAARDILVRERPDLVIQVADAKNLRRTLLLTLELQTMGFPLILNLNMMDEALQRRVTIDTAKLSRLMGIPVVPTVAVDGIGIHALKQSIKENITRAGSKTEKTIDSDDAGKQQRALFRRAITLYKEVMHKTSAPMRWLERLSNLTLRPVTGTLFLAFVLWVMYKFVGEFAAGTGVDFFEETVFGHYLNPWLTSLIDRIIPAGFIRDFLVGDYGIITMALTYAIAIILPILSAFFLFFSVLEDSGYLPRLAVLLNRLFRVIGLSGKAVIPMVLGFGCDTMATMTTRTLETRRERLIATLLLALAIPCSAQLGVILGMISGLSTRAIMIWAGVTGLVFFLAGALASKLLPGQPSDFILEIPPLRIPKINNLLVKTLARIEWYLREAVPLFVYATAVLFLLDRMDVLKSIEKAGEPIVVHLLGLPSGATEAFLIGFFRRDYGAAGLYALSRDGGMDPTQIVVSLVTITLFIPCIAQVLVMVKERGIKPTIWIVAFVFPFAFLTGGILNFILRHFHVAL